ncbi:nonstructural protein [Capybara microvirus Cap3_SP_535]|nr:nonstructural protein [Capybara microvirus Cap3_SP_535]
MKFLYSVKDSKAGCFVSFVVGDSDSVIQRGFISSMLGDSDLSNFPQDFDLYCLGSVNPITGFLEPLITPRLICSGFDAKSLALNLVSSAAASGLHQAGGVSSTPEEGV